MPRLLRYLYTLMAFYVTALVLMPCTDDLESQFCDSVEHHEGATEDHPEEGCSPFCMCPCCFHSLSSLTLTTFEVWTPEVTEHKQSLALSLPPAPAFAIWQPPKIAA